MNKSVLNWIETADYDIATAEAMLKAKRYLYVIFFCHLSVEKLLKGVVCRLTQRVPPKTHDLFLLLKLAKLKLPEDQQLLISHLNATSIPTRYPQDLAQLTRQYNLKVAQRYLSQTKKFLKWLKQNQRLKK